MWLLKKYPDNEKTMLENVCLQPYTTPMIGQKINKNLFIAVFIKVKKNLNKSDYPESNSRDKHNKPYITLTADINKTKLKSVANLNTVSTHIPPPPHPLSKAADNKGHID